MSLNSADVATLSRLLDQAMELPASEVEAWLAGLASEHGSLAPKLREMLAGRTGSSDFMASGPSFDEQEESIASAGERVGPYRLIREIGRGGMGAVWLAERVDGSLKRNIALKLPRLAWGTGLAARMARERDIGALLEHPHIARLYDAGLDERGRPFLALEYIDGVPLDIWCRERALDIPERLRLFMQIARAVAYAHGRLVVHRDLKPSNILVTADGQTHLLDFGIAKLIDDAAPGQELTKEQGRVLTLHYASPEQIQGETITVASDVYSLGVLLYEMLSGQRPYDSAARKTAAALELAILEGEPPLASSKPPDRNTVSELRGELDSILAKALRREPRQRYPTADAFADDVQRQVNGERVIAQPDSLAYRVRKTLSKHRTAFAAGGVVALAVLGGAGVSIVQAQRANDAAERAQVVKEFVVDVFKVNRSSPGNSELRQLPAQLLLERGANLIQSKFAGRPELQAELYGVVTGIFADMGLHRQGADFAARRIETLAAYDSPGSLRASALLVLARELAEDDRLPDAEARAKRALQLADGNAEQVIEAELTLAFVKTRQLLPQEAGQRLDAAERLLSSNTNLPATLRVDATTRRASWLVHMNRFAEAVPLYDRAIREAILAEGKSSPRASRLRISLAYDLASNGRSAEGKVFAQAAFSEMRQLAGPDDFATGVQEANLASYMLMNSGIPFKEALDSISRVRRSLDQSSIPIPEIVKARVAYQLGYAHLSWGDAETGYRLMAEPFKTLRPEARGPVSIFFLVAPFAIAAMESGHHAEASDLLAERLKLDKLPGRSTQPYSVYGYVYSAANHQMVGHLDQARAVLESAPVSDDMRGAAHGPSLYRDVLQLAKADVEVDAGRPEMALKLLSAVDDSASSELADKIALVRGAALCASNQPGEGFALLERGIEQASSGRYDHDPVNARWRTIAALCALKAGQRGRAESLSVAVHEAFAHRPGVSPYYKALLPELDRRLNAR